MAKNKKTETVTTKNTVETVTFKSKANGKTFTCAKNSILFTRVSASPDSYTEVIK